MCHTFETALTATFSGISCLQADLGPAFPFLSLILLLAVAGIGLVAIVLVAFSVSNGNRRTNQPVQFYSMGMGPQFMGQPIQFYSMGDTPYPAQQPPAVQFYQVPQMYVPQQFYPYPYQ